MNGQGRTVSRPAAVAGYVGLVVLMSAGAATGLSGSNTVYSDDIVDRSVTAADLGTNSVSRVKIQDNAVAGSEVIDGSITGAELANSAVGSAEIAGGAVTSDKVAANSLGRDKLAFSPVSDVVQVNGTRTYAANESAGHIVTCPNSSPVPLGAGHAFGSGNEAGFVVRGSIPLEHGWVVYGQNILPQAKALTVYVICASDGSSG